MKSNQTQSIGDDNCTHFKNMLTPGEKNDTDILTARKTLLSMIDSDYGATPVAKISLHSTFTRSTVSLGYV